jgi:hypothetical protein
VEPESTPLRDEVARFRPVADLEAAFGFHQEALQGSWRAAPGYRRADAELRRLTPGRFADERSWFETRWRTGEGEATAAHAQRLASGAAQWPFARWLGRVEVDVVVGMALGPLPRLLETKLGGVLRVAVGPAGPESLVALAALAHEKVPGLDALSLQPPWCDTLPLHLAATAVVADPALAPWLDRLLADAGRTLLPGPEREAAFERALCRLAETRLAQPRGEVERIARGLAKRRLDRLHRAWTRGFFVLRDSP